MKRTIIFLVAALALAARCAGQWAVFDVANLQQSVVNYGAMIEQLAKEAEQIANQVRQIQQMEERLKRMGNMADIKDVVGFPELSLDLNLPTKIRVWAGRVADGRVIFGDTRGGVFARSRILSPISTGAGSCERLSPTRQRSRSRTKSMNLRKCRRTSTLAARN
jgi:hypothetical protein